MKSNIGLSLVGLHLIRNAKLIFWDFDGVIKDSVDVKTQAFVKLFVSYGFQVSEKVKLHHESNGGMSRFEKIPLYLRWAGEEPTAELVNEFCLKFSQLVPQSVIDSPWVPGVEDYLRNNRHLQHFVLVSATPQEEIEHILQALDLQRCFAAVYGAPTTKKEAIRININIYNIPPHNCLMVGDARADMDAAQANHVPFLLRRHATNGQVFEQCNGNAIEDFTEL